MLTFDEVTRRIAYMGSTPGKEIRRRRAANKRARASRKSNRGTH